jgi:hypothetical protein
MGPSSELEYLLLLAHDLGYLHPNVYQSIQSDLVETRKMLNAFIKKPIIKSELLTANSYKLCYSASRALRCSSNF